MNTPPAPITEADLHAWADGHLAEARAREVEAYLAAHSAEAQRVEAWRIQKRELRALFDGVQDEPVPARLLRAANPRPAWYAGRFAAGVAVALLGGAAGWGLRGEVGQSAWPAGQTLPAAIDEAGATGFARHAAIAHAVYSPDLRRPVEVDAAHEEQLVAWLSKRMGTPMRPPQLQTLGYSLEGGRLLPGGMGPVAQFMYQDAQGAKLTLYVSNQMAPSAPEGTSGTGPASADAAFRFAREGSVNVFYWIDGAFGYALSSQAGRAELARISAEVYRQLGRGR